ncbi:NAD(P)-binding protein [Nocardia asteroides]|uniref:NAD(P)-binding protein n=1 Tax=Nocardia asteroides TaxID=1824 RepID=UPI0033EDBC79
MSAHVVVIGYGATGRSAAELLATDETLRLSVIDRSAERVRLAGVEGLSAVIGDGLDIDLLERVGVETADSVVVAVGDDEVAVRVTSIVRGLNHVTTVCTAVHDPAWEQLAQYLGADQVVIASRLCGRLLGRARVQPGLPGRVARFLWSRPEVVIADRCPRADESGRRLSSCPPLVLAARRDGRMLWRDAEVQEAVRSSDRLMVLSLSWGQGHAEG